MGKQVDFSPPKANISQLLSSEDNLREYATEFAERAITKFIPSIKKAHNLGISFAETLKNAD